MTLVVVQAGPGVSVQDFGRPGFLGQGLSEGGAADRCALHEGAALLGQPPGRAAIELAGCGAIFEARAPLVIALTGAPMLARLNGDPLAWTAAHSIPEGGRLELKPGPTGVYGYLHVLGGVSAPPVLGAAGLHKRAGIGQSLCSGSVVDCASAAPRPPQVLPAAPRFQGGTLRVVASAQTHLFAKEQLDRLQTGAFRCARADRQGIQLDHDGPGFHAEGGLTVVSDVVVPGDIQIAGDGRPYILATECQTTGGYPRIATVLPCDMPRAVQAAPGAPIKLELVTLTDARRIERAARADWAQLQGRVQPLVRDPRDLASLLGYELISGVTDGRD